MATCMEELTNCIVCFETFVNPQLLPCQHTFCKSCVENLTKDCRIKCPKCNVTSNFKKVKPDFRLTSFLDALAQQAVSLTQHQNNELKDEEPTAHQPKELQKTTKKPCELCSFGTIENWCVACAKWLCVSCKSSHAGLEATQSHRVLPMHEQINEFKAGVKLQIKALDSRLERLNSQMSAHEKSVEKLKTIQELSDKNLDELKQECLQHVDRYFGSVKQETQHVFHNSAKLQSAKQRKIQKKIAHMETLKAKASQVLKYSDTDRVIESSKLFWEVKSSLDTCATPARAQAHIQFPKVHLQVNPKWKEVKPLDINTVEGKLEKVIIV